jgi:hypothetical protein
MNAIDASSEELRCTQQANFWTSSAPNVETPTSDTHSGRSVIAHTSASLFGHS